MLEPRNAESAAGDGLLKAKTTITRIGRNKKAYTTTAQAVNPCLARSRLRTEALLFGGEQDVDDHEHRQRNHQRDRERRPEWLILSLVELIADDVADEFVVPAAEDVGNDVFARHGDEHQQCTGDNPRE